MTAFSSSKAFSLNWRIWLGIFIGVFVVTLLVALRAFYIEHSHIVPSQGGTYIEGAIGEARPLIPWFTVGNDVSRDVSSLVFSGLLRYDPQAKKIRDDLASLLVSGEGTIYTVTLKEDLKWHDSTEENPHYVTADDVVFTYSSILDPDFPNQILRQNFLGVEIRKVDERTVQFVLEEPYSFFASNLTLGLIPQRYFEGIPPSKFDQVLDFGFHPIGAGPYKFKSLVQTELSSEITLERFDRPIEPKFHLERIIFRIFPDYSSLLADIRNLDGVRLVPQNNDGNYMVPRQFEALQYSLPQYVALFFNLENPWLQDSNLRLGLQLGTDKQEISDSIYEPLIVDTPLLEIDLSDWRYVYDAESAQGAFYESNWHLPEKVRLQRLLEIREANRVGPLTIAPVALLDTGAVLTVTGSLTDAPLGSTINGVPVEQMETNTGAWIVALPTHGGTGSLALGLNLVRLEDEDGSPIDSFYLWRTNDPSEFNRASLEQDLVEEFVSSRDNPDVSKRLTVADLYTERGMLRRRISSDPQDIRVNDSGDRLTLTLLTSPSPPTYRKVAEIIRKQWANLGVHVAVEIPDSKTEFEERLLLRDYDVLLFGQSLLDNLDAYPYWHSSGIQKVTDNKYDLRIDAYNLSQYASITADGLLEVIRSTSDDQEREDALNELREVLKNDVPAIFLYSPQYAFAYTEDIQGVDLGDLSLHADRLSSLYKWYMKEERVFLPQYTWIDFFPWLVGQL